MLANRFLFFLDEYKRLSNERDTDVYMGAICNDMDYRTMGRHATMCSELEPRLATPVLFQAFRSIIDDTVNREVTVQGIVTTFIGLSIVMMLSNLQHRYVKLSAGDSLPIQKIKLT